MAESIPLELFSFWGVVCAAELVSTAENTKSVRFSPVAGSDGGPIPFDLFNRRRSNVDSEDRMSAVERFMSLVPSIGEFVSEADQDQQLIVTARMLGPLFTRSPRQQVLGPPMLFWDEPVSLWMAGAARMAELVSQAKAWTDASALVPAQEGRRDAAEEYLRAEVGQEALVWLSVQEREDLIDAFTAPAVSPRDQLQRQVSDRADELWSVSFSHGEESFSARMAQPVFGAETGVLQINLPFGIQALVAMALLQPEVYRDRSVRRCRRGACRQVRLMRSTQRYCSKECQHRDKSQRSRDRRRNS